MADMINTVIYGAIALGVLFLLFATIVLPYLNDTITYATGMGTTGTVVVSILVLVVFLALIGFALHYIPKKR